MAFFENNSKSKNNHILTKVTFTHTKESKGLLSLSPISLTTYELDQHLVYIFSRAFYAYLDNNSKSKNFKLTKVSFPKPTPKNLKDSNCSASYHYQPIK